MLNSIKAKVMMVLNTIHHFLYYSTQKVYYNNYIQTYGKASDCVGCKQCERECPQHIKITEFLKDVAKTFE